MLLLVTDTSGRQGRVALARAAEGSNEIHLIEVAPLTGGTFSAQLVPQIAAMLATHGLSKTDIGAFVVVSGPGSFTGLRVGLAAIKALAEILQKPIVPVSLLEAVVLASQAQGRVASALDAGRGEVYLGEYRVADDSAQLLAEQLLPKDVFLSAARQSTVVTPDQVLADLARAAGLPVLHLDPVSPGTVARLGWRKLQAGESVPPAQLDANYIRRTDAEILVKPIS